jgi:Flp pilus assembly protein CpaB
VLSVGGALGGESDSAAGARGGVTLSATIEQAQLLTQALLRGRLSLTLRNTDDLTLAEGLPETSSRDLLPSRDRSEAQRRPAATKGAIDHVR